jgi:hypothetical protein
MTTPSQTQTASGADRRVAQRFQPAFGTIYRFRLADGDSALVGLVWNISHTGISMLLAEPPQQGQVVEGELTTEAGESGLAITLKIVHVRKLSTGDYLLGAQFSRPLEAEEMRLFLTPPPRPQPHER